MINDKDGHIPSPLITVTCTVLCHALLEWEKNKDVHRNAFQSKLKAHRPDCTNCFNYTNDGGKNTSRCTAMGSKLLTFPGIADTYTFLMNTWNTLPESYQQRVYKNTLATVKHQIQHAENPTCGEPNTWRAQHVENPIRGEPNTRRTQHAENPTCREPNTRRTQHAENPTRGEPNTCHCHQHGSSVC